MRRARGLFEVQSRVPDDNLGPNRFPADESRLRKARGRGIKSTKPLGKRQAEEMSPAESIGGIMYGGLSYKTEMLD
jgi:hypothetical protein